ncbi:MAG: hypothetical protein ACLSD6_03910 [Clostridium sp.]
MEEDEEKSGYFTNYYGGIIHVKSCTNHVNCITEYRVLWFAVFGGVQLCRVGYSFACEAVGDTSKDLPPGQTKAFTISEDDGEFEVAKRLSNQDLVGNPAAFYVHMQLMKREGTDMQKGIYTLNSSMTYEEIIRVIYGL